MNKLLIGESNTKKDLYLDEDTMLVIDKYSGDLTIVAKDNIKIFINVLFSNLNMKYSTGLNTKVYMFTVDSSVCVDVDLVKDNMF